MDKRVRKSREALAHALTDRMREEPAETARPRLRTRDFWDHIRDQRALCDRLSRDPGWSAVTAHMEAFLGPRFAERLAALDGVPARPRAECELVGALLAGAVTGVLIAWYEGGMRLSPEALDALVAERVRL